jgi:putative membrane protein
VTTGPGLTVLAHASGADDGGSWIPCVSALAMLAGYVVLAVRGRRRGRHPWRLASFAAGCLVLAGALSPAFDAAADADFGIHMAQHLLVAMIGPTALVLGTPVSVVLRGLPQGPARRVARLLRTRPVHLLTRPVTALVLSSGGLIVLYFTPVYAVSTRDETVHALVHLHLIASGLLFAWVVAGADPAPRRAGVRSRLLALGVAVAVHATVAQLIFAGALVQIREPVTQMRAAGNLMYFGGDLAELVLAIALLATWRRNRPVARRPDPAAAVTSAA